MFINGVFVPDCEPPQLCSDSAATNVSALKSAPQHIVKSSVDPSGSVKKVKKFEVSHKIYSIHVKRARTRRPSGRAKKVAAKAVVKAAAKGAKRAAAKGAKRAAAKAKREVIVHPVHKKHKDPAAKAAKAAVLKAFKAGRKARKKAKKKDLTVMAAKAKKTAAEKSSRFSKR
ncbi:hypothetical protein T492DRAFT_844564 [Pavlovales sp. CCMP2436]|nr:hypothetical protein T492DRAFT_844564 [Pavlovales sp. CCMP2436]